MIEPIEEDENAFQVKSFQFDGIQYMVNVPFDTPPDTKSVISCSCPAYTFNYLACKHMFLLARWDPGYIVKGDHQPQRLDIYPNPSSSSPSQVPDPSPSSTSYPQRSILTDHQ
ncbi:hypothetical protein K492DRAFT_200084 [Lichtheimia hyalospora FSU 10163]|nr:hypothetical protein K492DRAFT_200084 [Lichtheimia hyalospora FSU 10163]